MAESTFSRKLDSSGRIMIPVKLREQVGLVVGEEYSFSVLEKDNRRFICIDCGPITNGPSLEEAINIVQTSGLKVVENDS